MGSEYAQTCPACAAGPVVASRDEDRHRRRASELYAASRQSFDEAREERRCAVGHGMHRHGLECDHASHTAEAEDAERAGRELSAEGDHEIALADAARDAMFAYVGKACQLCGGTGRISGNGSAQVGGSGKSPSGVGR